MPTPPQTLARVILRCPVRGCALPLEVRDRQAACSRGHSFDRARSGYWNLLQPQDRRSKQPGDGAEAVAGRRRIHDLGVTAPLAAAIIAITGAGPADTVLDAGCGEGFYLGQLTAAAGCAGEGVDLSTPAIEAAARRYPACGWVVANADRELPYTDGAFSRVLSITARMNAPEFARVLSPEGRLMVAIPGPEDLIELRGEGRDRVERTVESFAAGFVLEAQQRVTARAALDAEAVAGLRAAIYRPRGATPEAVTFSLDLLRFRRR